jgi:hypothetical protein
MLSSKSSEYPNAFMNLRHPFCIRVREHSNPYLFNMVKGVTNPISCKSEKFPSLVIGHCISYQYAWLVDRSSNWPLYHHELLKSWDCSVPLVRPEITWTHLARCHDKSLSNASACCHQSVSF